MVRPHARREASPVKRVVVIAAVVLGLAFIAVAIVYWVTPSNSLPGFFPGHRSHSTQYHGKHGLAAFLIGLGLLTFAWAQRAPKKTRRSA
jgi:heme/copper-type cytochrome/quinol oxidase subunit 3